MAKQPSEMTSAELAQEMWKRADSLDHHTCGIGASTLAVHTGSRDQRISATAAAVAAIVAAYVAYRGGRLKATLAEQVPHPRSGITAAPSRAPP